MDIKVIADDYMQRLRVRATTPAQFPSELHEVAFEIAVYFKEPYPNWVRFIRDSHIYPAFVRNKFDDLKGYSKYSKKDSVKALMAYLGK